MNNLPEAFWWLAVPVGFIGGMLVMAAAYEAYQRIRRHRRLPIDRGAILDLEAKRWDAVEWMREKGIVRLEDQA
jgi:hypothetical protein